MSAGRARRGHGYSGGIHPAARFAVVTVRGAAMTSHVRAEGPGAATPAPVGRPSSAVYQSRRRAVLVIGAAAGVGLIVKILLNATSFGTADVWHWLDFAQATREYGPIDVYSYPFDRIPIHRRSSFYNHPPLIGYYLELINGLDNVGVPLRFSIRLFSSLADIASAFIVFAIVQRRADTRLATMAGVAISLSPILVIISGFHGNTDPVFVMFALLAAYLLVDRRRPGWAGLCMAIALGIKIVPVVAIPALLVWAYRAGRPVLLRFAGALVGASALWWVPALALQWRHVMGQVLGYAGVNPHSWGLDGLFTMVGLQGVAGFVEGPARLLIVAACALLPAWLSWRRPSIALQAAALSLPMFLLLTPTFGTQYIVWAAAPLLVAVPRWGVVWNLIAGTWLFWIYDRWNRGLPWREAEGGLVPYTVPQLWTGLLVWLCLGVGVVVAARDLLGAGRSSRSRPGPAGARHRSPDGPPGPPDAVTAPIPIVDNR